MEWSGLALLFLVGAGIVTTGLPATFLLIAAATLGALLGFVTDKISLSILSALPSRLINLLENDLLQALPLYVTMGLLLGRLPVADALYRTGNALLPKRASAPLVSTVLLGALLGPMNGSVGASVLGLSQVIAPRLTAQGVPAATRDAMIAVAATLGVLVPPSLVLILLGDAMLSAHTLAVTATGRSDRVINTQDVFHAALAPAGIFLLLCLVLAWYVGRNQTISEAASGRPSPQQIMLAVVCVVALIVLLGGVVTGYFYAVEAAAMGAFALLSSGLITGHLRGSALREVLRDALAITGALFSLLIAATTFTLVARLLGTDALVNNLVAGIPGGDVAAVAVVLGVLGICAFVLDAFEIIFVVVPIIIPPLLIRVADARWVAALVLLTLQASYLLPPFGYALMMVRGAAKAPAPFGEFLRALCPFLIAQWVSLLVVLMAPRLAHLGEDTAASNRTGAPVSAHEINRRLNEMLPLPPEIEPK
jgi:tripartite ATP-independent transporter DctM subunit